MPQLIFAPSALRDVARLREFLRPKNPAAAKRTAVAIIKAVQVLAQCCGIFAQGVSYR